MTIYNTLYKTINKINKHMYVRVHITENPYDNYLGSGDNLRRAIKKYGIENFTKEILFYGFNKEDAFWAESLIVDKEFIARKDTYNKTIGGNMPPNHLGFKRTQESKNKTSRTILELSRKGLLPKPNMLGNKNGTGNKNRPWSREETIAHCIPILLTLQTGESFHIIDGHKKFCQEHHFSLTTLEGMIKTGNIPKWGSLKGAIATKLS